MRIGLFLTGVSSSDMPPQRFAAETVSLVREARDAGLGAVVAGQHLVSAPTQYLQPVALLSRLVPETGAMALVTGVVLLPLFNPIDVAEQVATLDVLSDGRAVLGVGAGYRAEELSAFGVDRRQRFRLLEESLGIVRDLWRGGEVHHHGQAFHLDVPPLSLRPVQLPGPPVWLAAMGARPLARARRLGCTPFVGPGISLPELRDWFADAELLSGFSEVALRRELYLGTDASDVVRREAVEYIGRRYEEYRRWGLAAGGDGQDLESYLTERAVVGGPEECLASLLEYRRLGVSEVVLRCTWPGLPWSEAHRMIHLLGSEVIPALQAA